MFVSVSDCCLILWIFTLYPKGDWFCRRPSREWWSVTQIESVRFEGDQRSHQLCSCEGFHFEGVQSRPEVKRRVWIGTMSPRVETGNDHSRIVQSRWFQVDHASSSCEKPGMSPDSSTFISCAKARTGAHYQHKTEGWDLGLRLVAWTNCWSSKENCSYILVLREFTMTTFQDWQYFMIWRDKLVRRSQNGRTWEVVVYFLRLSPSLHLINCPHHTSHHFVCLLWIDKARDK